MCSVSLAGEGKKGGGGEGTLLKLTWDTCGSQHWFDPDSSKVGGHLTPVDPVLIIEVVEGQGEPSAVR